MVRNGARNIVLVSRSGSAAGKVKELVDELAAVGANILVRRCDVSNSKSVENLISNELVGVPEVRGVIHGAMVLHVSYSRSILRTATNMSRMSCLRK